MNFKDFINENSPQDTPAVRGAKLDAVNRIKTNTRKKDSAVEKPKGHGTGTVKKGLRRLKLGRKLNTSQKQALQHHFKDKSAMNQAAGTYGSAYVGKAVYGEGRKRLSRVGRALYKDDEHPHHKKEGKKEKEGDKRNTWTKIKKARRGSKEHKGRVARKKELRKATEMERFGEGRSGEYQGQMDDYKPTRGGTEEERKERAGIGSGLHSTEWKKKVAKRKAKRGGEKLIKGKKKVSLSLEGVRATFRKLTKKSKPATGKFTYLGADTSDFMRKFVRQKEAGEDRAKAQGTTADKKERKGKKMYAALGKAKDRAFKMHAHKELGNPQRRAELAEKKAMSEGSGGVEKLGRKRQALRKREHASIDREYEWSQREGETVAERDKRLKTARKESKKLGKKGSKLASRHGRKQAEGEGRPLMRKVFKTTEGKRSGEDPYQTGLRVGHTETPKKTTQQRSMQINRIRLAVKEKAKKKGGPSHGHEAQKQFNMGKGTGEVFGLRKENKEQEAEASAKAQEADKAQAEAAQKAGKRDAEERVKQIRKNKGQRTQVARRVATQRSVQTKKAHKSRRANLRKTRRKLKTREKEALSVVSRQSKTRHARISKESLARLRDAKEALKQASKK